MPIVALLYSTNRTSINSMKDTLDKIDEIAKKELNGKKEGLFIAADLYTIQTMMEDIV